MNNFYAYLFFITLLLLSCYRSTAERIGVYTGSFDPVHLGHVTAVDSAIEKAKLDLVIVTANPTSPHKKSISDVKHRNNMLKYAFEHNKKVSVIELLNHEFEPTWFLQLLELINDKYKNSEVFQIVGADAVDRYQDNLLNELKKPTGLIVISRPPYLGEPNQALLSYGIDIIKVHPTLTFSSTKVKNDLKLKGFSYFVHPKVSRYIFRNSLYAPICLKYLTDN